MRRPAFKLFGNRAGNVALIFALTAPVMILISGGAVDMFNVFAWRSQLQDAADATAIGAVARSSPGYKAALTMTGDGTVSSPAAAANAQAIFDADRNVRAPITVTSLNVDIEKTGQTVSDTVTAQATFPTSFLGLIGQRTLTISVNAHAADNIPTYMNFYLLLDNTPSMGLGATTADITALVNATGGCAFACHATTNSSQNYYATARSIGATLRIDVVAQATASLMQTATNTENADGAPTEFGMAIYDFGAQAYTAPALATISGLTTDLMGTSAPAAANVQLMTVPDNNDAYDGPNQDEDTDFDYMFQALSTVMAGTASGNGSSSSAPQQVLFLVTDGMVDMNNNGSRQMGGINAATCQTVKNNGIKIAILYTTYIPSSISNDPWSQQNVLPIISPTDTVGNALSACASPGLFYAVSPSQGIPQAMAALFNIVVANARITS